MSGICLYDSIQDLFTSIKKLDALIIEITEDKQKRLWIATQGKGIFQYTHLTNKWKHYNEQKMD